ncbi:hypothetical protein PS906_00531 [Pseudomonas fluorescens]|uniref:Uncharacterized protein n=1 Tax=Pseudomonas fluorescens TaxID=294 RepID=A0ABD7V8X8_PSEFL|nr:hypothetical protein PS732_00029 [Pseudomonas fluorescens]VVO74477.1 hypothetical protein PS876_01468 [Pseudomonas fluorescens]VVP64400.1 hypothetical protein PS906_00531 [Pseudomonas fluorescens]
MSYYWQPERLHGIWLRVTELRPLDLELQLNLQLLPRQWCIWP